MKMPHVDDHILRAPKSPHLNPQQPSYQVRLHDEDRERPRNCCKMPTEAEVTPPRDSSLPQPPDAPTHHRWRKPAFKDVTHSSNVNSPSPYRNHSLGGSSTRRSNDARMETPPESPHTPVIRQEYSAYEGPYQYPPYGPPMSHRGGSGGYSYYQHGSHRGPPPFMPLEPPHAGHSPHYHHPHHQHPDSMMSGPPPPPPPPQYSTPSRYSPAHYPPHDHYYPYADSSPSSLTPPPPPSSGHYDYEYHANFIPPSTSMTSATASLLSSPSEDEYNYYYQHPHQHHHPQHHRFDAMSPQSLTSMHPTGGGAEVSQVEENDVLCGR